MGNPQSVKDFPDQSQRGGVCASQWDRRRRNRRWDRVRYRTLIHRNDPTNTGGIIRAYIADFNRRWRKIIDLIVETVVVNNALHLGEPLSDIFELVAAQAAGPFQFRQDAGKVEDFNNWLSNLLDDDVLEVRRSSTGRVTNNSKWQDTFVRSAYSRGLNHAEQALRSQGIPFDSRTVSDLFNAPLHRGALELLYTRQFTDLQGITTEVSDQISRVLTEGLATGQGPLDMARTMRKRIEVIGMTRSKVLARTEIIRVHAESTLNRYQDAGVDQVTVFAEFVTAGDDRVCQTCQDLETGEAIALNEARGVIPVHANCRCAWLPVLPD